ncbi:MAG: RND family transporter [Christensenellaceae bacterium]
MQKFYSRLLKHPIVTIACFAVLAIVCALLQNLVGVNYEMADYLPEDSPSTVAVDIMEEEFDEGIPNARVMVQNVSIAQALEYKEKIKNIDGVTEVTWLDDAVDVYQPLETMDRETVETYYKDNAALFSVTMDESRLVETVAAIRSVIGEDNAMAGSGVSTAVATTSTVKEINVIVVFAVLVVIIVLVLTTSSRIDPVVILLGLGVAILINNGTNLIFGTIFFITNAAGAILQLAVSLDYSVFLMHRFDECLKRESDPKQAMVNALCRSTPSILSSGLTTVIGFLALVFMRFGIGPDLGLALAKGIAISLITVFVFMPALILKMYPLMQKTRHDSIFAMIKNACKKKKGRPGRNKADDAAEANGAAAAVRSESTGHEDEIAQRPSGEASAAKKCTFGTFVTKIMVPMVCVFAVIMIPGYLASNQNSFLYGSSKIFDTQTQLGRDTQEIEEIFGKSDTYVLLVPRGNLEREQQLSDALHEIPEIKSVLSYVDTVGAEIPYEYLDEDTLSLLVSQHYSRFVLTVEADYEGEETFALVETLREITGNYYTAYHLAGEGVSTYDLMDTITADMVKVNLIAIASVFVVLLITMKSVSLPVILVLAIETAIWVNMAIPYFVGAPMFYIAYLIVSSIQLGATVDYAILFTDTYMEFRRETGKKEAIERTVPKVTVSLLTSGTVLAVVGFLLAGLSSHGILSQLGLLIGRGTLLSLGTVFFVLPGLLYLPDRIIKCTTLHCHFKESKKSEAKTDENNT